VVAALADRYRLVRPLGEGGMATVYLAEDLRHGRQVAIKFLKPELGAAIGPARFAAEIRVTATLQHPHLLPLFDSGEAAGQLFYVMPFVAGETLRARLAREGQLPLGEAVRLTRALAVAAFRHHRHRT
jgi:serine/threonine-protein kinase